VSQYQYTNPIKTVSIQFEGKALLTIHNDDRVTTGSKLNPDETAALVLDQIKTQWMKDAQSTKIRELEDQLERLENWKQSALSVEREWNANAIATMLGGKLGESQREVIQREVPKLLERIKRLEEAGDALKAAGYFGGFNDAVDKWIKVKEAKP